MGPEWSRKMGWGCSSCEGLDRIRAGLWTGDKEPGGAWSRGPILGGGDEVAWGMVSEYGGIKVRPSIHYRVIPPTVLGTTTSQTSHTQKHTHTGSRPNPMAHEGRCSFLWQVQVE